MLLVARAAYLPGVPLEGLENLHEGGGMASPPCKTKHALRKDPAESMLIAAPCMHVDQGEGDHAPAVEGAHCLQFDVAVWRGAARPMR